MARVTSFTGIYLFTASQTLNELIKGRSVWFTFLFYHFDISRCFTSYTSLSFTVLLNALMVTILTLETSGDAKTPKAARFHSFAILLPQTRRSHGLFIIKFPITSISFLLHAWHTFAAHHSFIQACDVERTGLFKRFLRRRIRSKTSRFHPVVSTPEAR